MHTQVQRKKCLLSPANCIDLGCTPSDWRCLVGEPLQRSQARLGVAHQSVAFIIREQQADTQVGEVEARWAHENAVKRTTTHSDCRAECGLHAPQ